MIYLDFALVVYAQRKSGNSPYDRKFELREESWGLLKVLLGTAYAHLEQDLATLAVPADLRVTTYDDTMVRLYECKALKWSTHYPEGKRVREAVHSIGGRAHMCAEMVGIDKGQTVFYIQKGLHSNLLKTVTSIQVNL